MRNRASGSTVIGHIGQRRRHYANPRVKPGNRREPLAEERSNMGRMSNASEKVHTVRYATVVLNLPCCCSAAIRVSRLINSTVTLRTSGEPPPPPSSPRPCEWAVAFNMSLWDSF